MTRFKCEECGKSYNLSAKAKNKGGYENVLGFYCSRKCRTAMRKKRDSIREKALAEA